MLWNCISPLAPVFAALFCEGDLTIFDKITIKGSAGYEGFVLPLIKALGIPVLKANKNADGTWSDDLGTEHENEGELFLSADKYIDTYAEYKTAVYGADGIFGTGDDNAKVMLTTITDALFALVDSLCARPVNTILTILPYLAHFIESDGIDTILGNLLVPVSTITSMIDKIYEIDLLAMIKDLLRGIIKDMNDKAGKTSDSTEPEDQETTGGAAAAYVLNAVETAEEESTSTGLEDAISALTEPNAALDLSGGDSKNYKFKDIIADLIDGISINGTKLSDIIDSQTIFVKIASTAWLPALTNTNGETVRYAGQKVTVTIDEGRRSGSYAKSEATVYTVDRESVLINVLNDIVFTDGIRDLLGNLLKFDFSTEKMTTLTEEDSNYLLTVLLYGVFEDPEALERLLVDLLSWYEVEYQDARVSGKDFTGVATTEPIDYETIGLDKAQMEQLPADFDSLIAKIVPAVIGMLPEDALGDIKLSGANMEEMVHNLLVDLMTDKEVENDEGEKEMKYGFATQLIQLLAGLLGGNATVASILPMIPEIIPGVELELKEFKKANAALNTYFKDYDTWADAYEALKTVKKYVAPEEPAADYVAPPYEEGTLNLYAVSDDKPVAEYALNDKDEKIPVYANGTKVTDAWGSVWYTSAGSATTKDEKPLESTFVVKTVDGKIVYQYQYELILTNTDSFGIETYRDVLDLVSNILTPLAPILRFLLTEMNLVLLDGVTLTGGDGYDRFIIPLFEVLGVDEYIGEDKFLDKHAFAALDNAAFTAKVIEYIDALITMVVTTPIQTIVDLVPQLVFFIYSDGLAQAVEQLVAPLLTLVDMVNDITAKEVVIEGRDDALVALDIVGLITDLINDNLLVPNNIAEVEGFYGSNGLIERILTGSGLEALLQGLLDNANAWKYAYEYTIPKEMIKDATKDEVVTVYFNKADLDGAAHVPTNGNGKDKTFYLTAVPEKNKADISLGLDKDGDGTIDEKQLEGIFAWIISKTCTIEDVDTVRYFDATVKSGSRQVKGVVANRADTLVQIISETLLGGDMLTSLLNSFGVKLDDTVKTILEAVTGENRYVIFVVLLKYFNEYDVETMVMDYLSFEKVEYAYETYVDGTKLTQRKLRRAIKKLDGSILTIVPELIPLLEENETIKALIEKIGGYTGQSLKDLVHELLEAYAFNDQTMNQLMGLLIGLLGGEDLEGTLSTVLPLVKDIVGIDITPYGFYQATTSDAIKAYMEAAFAAFVSEPVVDENGEVVLAEDGTPKMTTVQDDFTWTDLAKFYTVNVYSYNEVETTTKYEYTYEKDGKTEYYYDVEDDAEKIKIDDVEYTLTASEVDDARVTKDFYSYTTNYKYTRSDLGENTAVEGVDGKVWFPYEQATDADGKLLWADEANGIPEAKTEKVLDEDGNETGETVKVRATRVNALEGDEAFAWGIDRAASRGGYDGAKNAFIDILAGIVVPLEGVLNFLLRGESLMILPDENNADSGVLEFYGNNGYDNVIKPLFQALAVDQFGTIVSTDDYMAGKGTALTLTAITDGIFTIVEAITEAPLEYIFTLLPSLSYFISCNGPEIVLNNLLSPVLALLDLADPVVGDLLDELLGATLSGVFSDFMPEDIAYTDGIDYKSPIYVEVDGKDDNGNDVKVKVQATDNGETIKFKDKTYYITAGDGEPVKDAYVVETTTDDEGNVIPEFKHYNSYALTDLLKICGENGDNLVKILNELVGGLILGKDATEDEVAAFQLLPETFFEDYPAHTITINKATSTSSYYYWYRDSEGKLVKVADNYYEPSMGEIEKARYVVDWFKVDIADSAVYLLDNVLSESLLNEIAKLAKVDVNDESNILGVILKNLIDGKFNGLVVADIITALFENYTITYNDLYGEYITPDHSHLDVLDDADQIKADKVPAQLDNIIENALPVLAPILSDLLAPKDGKEPTILNDIFDNYSTIAADENVNDLYEVVNYLLDDMVWSDELVNTLAGLIINLVGDGGIVGTIVDYIGLTGIKLDPQSYIATIEKAYANKAEVATAVATLKAIIGNAETWADVVKSDATPLYAYEYVVGVDAEGKDQTVRVHFADSTLDGAKHVPTSGEYKGNTYTLKAVLDADKNHVVKLDLNKKVEVLDEKGQGTGEFETKAEADWGINAATDKKAAFISAIAVILEPLFPVLQLVLQGKTLTLVGHDKTAYEPVNTYEYDADGVKTTIIDDSRTGEEIGNGYVELMGVNGYEELLVPILDSIGGLAAFGAYDATNNPDGIMTAAEFCSINNAYDMLDYIVNVIFGFVNSLTADPVVYLATYLPSLLYFLGSDGVYNAVHSVLQLVNGLIAVVEPLIGSNGIKLSDTISLPLDLKMLKLEDTVVIENVEQEDGTTKAEKKVTEGLCTMINNLLPASMANFKLSKGMILKLAGYLGDYKVISTVRSTASSALIKIDEDGNMVYVDKDGNAITDANPAETNKITTIVGDTQYTLTGLLQFALADGLVGNLVDTTTMTGILKSIIDNVMSEDATENVSAVLIKLLNKYVITYQAIEDPAEELVKIITDYTKYGVEKTEVQIALANLQALIPEVLNLLDLGSLETLVADNLYTDKVVNGLIAMLVGLLGGMDEKTWNTIVDILGYVKDIVGLDINLTPAYYAQNSVLKDFINAVEPRMVDKIGEDGKVVVDANGKPVQEAAELTWADVAAHYTKYEYRYKVADAKEATATEEAQDAKYVTVWFADANLDGADHTPTSGDYAGKTYKLEKVETTSYEYEYTVKATEEGKEDEVKTVWSSKTDFKEVKDGDITYSLEAGTLTKTGETEITHNTKVESDFVWGLADEKTLNDKADRLIEIVTDLLKPLDCVLELLLAGGTYDFATTGKYGDSLSAFEEINIMGGSGYNYAIIPLLEALSVPADSIKTQAEYEATIETKGTLGYILETILYTVNDNLDTPLDFVLGLFANLAYAISKDGATTLVSNLIAPLSEVVKAIEGVLPVAIKVDLMQLVDGGTVAEILLGSDVALKGAEVGLSLDLDCDTLETLVAKLLAKFVAGFDIEIDFSDIAAKAALADEMDEIIYSASKVDPKWDICIGTPGRNISGDTSASIITLLSMVITPENIEALLDMLKVDLSTLDAELKNIIDKAIDNPDALIGAVIKLLASNYSLETLAMVFYFLGEAEYDYSNIKGGLLNGGHSAVNSAIAKFDKMVNNLIPKLLKLLGNDLDKPVEIIADIYNGLGTKASTATIKDVVDYLLTDLAFNDKMMNTIIALIVDLLGGIDAKTFTTITDIVKEVLGIDLSPAGVAAISEANGGKIADFIESHVAEGKTIADLTWAEIAGAHQYYEYRYCVQEAKDAVGTEGEEDYQAAVEAEYVTVHFESADLDGADHTPTSGDYAGKTYKLEAVKTDKGERVTKAVLTETWNVSDKDSFLNIFYEITAVVEPLLAFLFKGENINILIDDLHLVGNNGYENAIVPLAKALNIEIEEDADKFSNANDMLKEVVDGIFGLVEDIEKKPISTILELLGSASYFIANNGVEIVLKNLISPVTGLLKIFDQVITMDDINALLKKYIKMSLDEITGIAGEDGSKLVSMINGLLPKVELVGEDGAITVAEPLPAKFFEIMSTYAINYDSMTNAQKIPENIRNDAVKVTDFSVDKADVLMYLLSTVCSDDFLAFIAKLAKAEEGTMLGDVIYGLSGDEDLVINIISMLLNEYTLVYNKYAQVDIKKENVDPKAPLTDDNLTAALAAIDGLVPTLIGLLVKDADSLKSLVEGLVAGADLGNLLMNLLVPLLAGLNIDDILGYVKEFTNLDIKLDPSAWTADSSTVVAKFINEAADLDENGAISWAEVEENYKQYVYTYTKDGKDVAFYSTSANEKTYSETTTVDGTETTVKYDLSKVYEYEYTYTAEEEGKQVEKTVVLDKNDYATTKIGGKDVAVTYSKALHKQEMHSNFDWNIDTFDALKDFAVELLKPLDVVFELLLSGGEIIAAPDNKPEEEPYPAQITIRGGEGYNFAIVPLLEALGATDLLSQAEYEAKAEADGSHLEYVLDVLFTEVEEILDTPVSQLLSRLANLFYFVGNNGINTLAENLLAPVNTLIDEIDPVFPLAITIDISKVGVEGASVLATYLGKAHDGVPAGITVNVEATALANLINDLLGGIEINGQKLGLSLDLNWTQIAAKMAKTEDEADKNTTGAEVKKIASAMDYNAYENVEGTTAIPDGKYYNIEGDVVDTFVTLLQVLLTADNTEAIKNLVLGLLEDGEVKDILGNILSDPDAIEELIGVVVLLLTGESALTDYPFAFAYKFLGELDFTYRPDEIANAISKFDKILDREAVTIIKLIGTPDENVPAEKYSFINKMAVALDDDDKLADIVAWLLGEFAFTASNFDSLMAMLNNILADNITADLAGIIKTILPIDLMPYEFAKATGNADLIKYVARAYTDEATEAQKQAVTWKDVRNANAYEVKNADNETEWSYIRSWKISGKDAFVNTLLDLLKPLNPILNFILTGDDLAFEIEGVKVWGADGYANAIVPLLNALGAKQLGIDVPETAVDSTDAIGRLVNVLLGADYEVAAGDEVQTQHAKGVVDAICEAPLTAILTIVGNLSYFLANDNLAPLIKNLVAPVLGIVELAESLISMDELDGLIEGLAKITLPGGKPLNITNIINIAGEGGSGLVALINDLLGGIKAYEKIDGKLVEYTKAQVDADTSGATYAEVEVVVKDADGNTVIGDDGKAVTRKIYCKVLQVINLLPDDFFVDFAKYVVEDSTLDGVAVTRVGNEVDNWSINPADALMYVLSMVLDYDFFETILKKVGLDLSQGIGATVLTMADKENELVDVLVMLLNDYSVVYSKVEQAPLDTATAPYSSFGTDAQGENILDNENTTNAIAALDPLINTIIGMVAGGKTLGGLVDGLVAGADLGNLLMNLLVPVLAGLDIDAILEYVNELTNLGLSTLSPALWAENEDVAFGSELKNFLDEVPTKKDKDGKDLALTWADVEEYYSYYVYEYEVKNDKGVVTGKKNYYSKSADLTKADVDNDATTADVAVSKVMVDELDKDNNATGKKIHSYGMHSQFDWKIEDLNDLVPFVCDLLQPLDVVFQILLSGKPIVALEDTSGERADIRIMGGVGYNYAIIPLLEAFGATDLLTQEEYDEQVAVDGSSLKYVLEKLIEEVDEILATPLNELLSRLANLFYFIGSDGINTIADNLLAPLNTLIEEVDDLFPLAIRIDVAAEEILGLYLGKEHEGVPAGITVNVAGDDLAELINSLIGNLTIGETTINLSLDLDWVELASKMAKRDADNKILTTGTKQVYNIGTVKNASTPDLVNITGDAANAIVTLLDTVLTKDNCENIYNLVIGILPADLDANLKGLIEDVLGSEQSIKGLVAAVVLILTGEYEVTTLDYVFKFLGALDFAKAEDAATAIESLDKVVIKAVPVIIEMLAKDKTDKDDFLYKLYNGTGKNATLENVVDYLLGDFLFTDDMMATITGALLGILKNLGADLTKTLKDILGVDLAPVAFAAATGNQALIDYVNVTPANAEDGVTWADVAKAHGTEEPVYEEDGKTQAKNEDGSLKTKTVYDAVFSGIDGKDAFVGAILDLLKPLESILAFLLTGEDLVITIENNGEKAQLTLKGGNAYETAIVPILFQGLGLEELMTGTNKSVATAANGVTSANAAIEETLDYILVNLIDAIEKAPLTTIITVVANLGYFIANDDVAVAIQNLVAPVLAIVDALGGVISRSQIDTLIEGLAKIELPNGKMLNLTNIINIAGDNGAILVDLINGLLPSIKMTDSSGKEVGVAYALPETFFLDLAKAAVEVKAPTGTLTANKTDVTEWTTDTGAAIMYVLSTVLSTDFLTILCEVLKLEPTVKDDEGNEKENMVYNILMSLADSEDSVVDLILMLLNRYLVEYQGYYQPVIDKTEIKYDSEAAHDQFNQVITNLDGAIPLLLDLLMKEDENGNKPENLGDIVYPLFVKDDIANMLVGAIVKLLAGLPAETLDMIEGYVSDLSNLKNSADGKSFSIAPQNFTNGKFGSKLAAYIGNKTTWKDVWMAHSEETTDDKGNKVRVATAYAWGIDETEDLINLVCDFLMPLDCVLSLLLQGGMVEAEFDPADPNNTFVGKTLAVLDEIAISGGSGYNYAIVPLLEVLGIEPKTQEDYDTYVAANKGSTLHYVLTAIFDRVDEILNAPIANVLEILPNLCYVLATGSVATIVENLIAPINHVISAVDPIFPIAIPVDVGALIAGEELTLYLGKEHPGIDAGISFKLEGNDIATLLEDVVAGIAINDKALNLKVNLDWLELAKAAGADNNGDGSVDFNGSVMDTKWDIYNGDEYKNLVGDPGDTFVTLIKTILTEENWKSLKEALGLDLGDFNGVVDGIIKDPTSIISLIAQLLGGGSVSYIPVQNRAITMKNFDYSTYLALTEYNADVIAANIDNVINKVLGEAGIGSIRGLLANYISNDTLNSLLDMIVNLLAGDSIGGILDMIGGFTQVGANGEEPLIKVGILDEEGKVTRFEYLDLDLTVKGYADKYDNYSNANKTVAKKLASAASWKDVGSFKGTDWGIKNGDLFAFVNALSSVLNPLNSVLELLLLGDGKQLSVLPSENAETGELNGAVNIKGGDGYDYAIIPLLEAFGLKAADVKTVDQYRAYYTEDNANLMGYILNRVAYFADDLLNKPVDKLLEILPNLAYFISNEGIYLVVRNLIAPIYSILAVLGIDLAEVLDLNELLGGINIPIQLLGAKYNLSIPEIDFYELARQGAADIKEVKTSRSQAANSFVNGSRIKNQDDLDNYIKNYPSGYKGRANKTTQTNIVSDKGDTLTLVLTWVLEIFGDAKNREALVNWLAEIFQLQSGAKTTVAYAIDKLFDTCDKYGVADLIVAALFEVFGIGIVLDATLSGDAQTIQGIYEELFAALSSGGDCAYKGIAETMEQITGVWNDTIGDHEDYEDAEQEAEESLNWFQRLIAKIKAFFEKIFSVFK